jgi:chromosome segregation protein
MFKLQRLEITGFKSFADYTEIVFTGNGITAVVGPNGCGKSNVSDSISWVLGEQRAKSLRGGEMKDVVFQGTRNRKPSGMAEVVLHLVRDEDAFDIEESELEDIDEALSEIDDHVVDLEALGAEEAKDQQSAVSGHQSAVGDQENGFHTESVEVETVQALQVGSVQTVEKTVKTKRHWRPRSFALDFAPGEAVSVTRRLYLSGESEYQLNGKTCRLRDIQDLFAGTGLSGSHYAIVEQGRIGQVLSAKPNDRRNLIEEAAGISKFRTRQRAAESRLETAKSNLSRIFDIISEIEKQAGALRRQASKTRRYIVLQDEFRSLLRQLFAAEGRHLSLLIDELRKAFEAAVETERQLAAKVTETEEAFRTTTQNARQAEENLTEIRQKHSANALERDRAQREHRYQSEQIVSFQNRSKVVASEVEATTERLKLVASELSRLQKDEEKEAAEADASRLVLIEAEKQYADKIDDVRQIEAALDARRAEVLKHTAAVERFDEVERQLSNNLHRLGERREGLERERLRAEQTLEENVAGAAKLSDELGSESAKLAGFQAERQKIQVATSAARESLRVSEEKLRAVESDHSRTRNRLETLQELDEKKAVYAPSVQKLFTEQEKIGVKFGGVLADLLDVEESAEKAVENLFGNFLQAVLVNSVADAERVLSWIRDNKAGRTAVLVVPPAGGSKTPSAKGKTGTIENILGIDGPVAAELREIFPREMSAELVDGFDGNKQADEKTLVNYEGELRIGGRLFVSGRETSDKKNDSLLAFKRELSVLGKSVSKLEKEIEKARATAEADRKALAENEEKTVDLQSLIIKIERGLHGLEIQEKSIRQEIERAERHRKVVADETVQVEHEIAEIQDRISEAKTSQASAQDFLSQSSGELERIGQELAKARTRSDAENLAVNEKRTMAATSGERRRSAQAALRRVEHEQSELQNRVANLEKELAEIGEKLHSLHASVSGIADLLAGTDTAVASEATELNEAAAAVSAARAEADAVSERLAETNHRAVDAMNERASIEVRQAEAVTRLQNITEKCEQELNVPFAELVEREEVPADFELHDARRKVDDLRARLESFGAINMLAVDELEETEERLLFLTSQRQDIVDSILSTEEALKEIKERSRAKFKEAFEAINANFVQYFQELFGGGRGEMTLLESEDVLEAGIEIVAQPPGKRLQNILLLSGGEKAMTAIALVLAIFKYRPAPFCLLDEVDAPLDEANVGRFVNKVAEMSEKTQFIVITHNKRTMEAARALYGVTMQEAGVSKVVSVKFD